MKIKLPVVLPTNIRQGEGSVVELLGAVARNLKDKAEADVAGGQSETSGGVRERHLTAVAIHDCMNRIRRESSELWRQIEKERKARETLTPGDTCPRPDNPTTTGDGPPS